MLHWRDAITTDNDAVHKISNENVQILEALEGTITNHKLKRALIGKVPRQRQLSLTFPPLTNYLGTKQGSLLHIAYKVRYSCGQ